MTTHWSIALRDIPAPDYADAVIIPLAPGDSVDPAAWAVVKEHALRNGHKARRGRR